MENHPSSISLHYTSPQHQWDFLAQNLQKTYHQSDTWALYDTTPTIASVRTLIAFAAQTPFADKKIAILGFADQLRPETANALLKVLEEPPPYLTIVLLSESGRLLPTIQSRVAMSVSALDHQALQNTADQTNFQRWHDLLSSYTVEDEDARNIAQRLLYLQPLNHPAVNQDEVLQAYQ